MGGLVSFELIRIVVDFPGYTISQRIPGAQHNTYNTKLCRVSFKGREVKSRVHGISCVPNSAIKRQCEMRLYSICLFAEDNFTSPQGGS